VTRPSWEVADVIRIAGSRFRERYGSSLTWPQVKVLRAIARCRTAALGGHLDVCTGCGYITGISYNSAGTGIARSARRALAIPGSPSANRNCCR
jgi:Transposase zinc-binding domain